MTLVRCARVVEGSAGEVSTHPGGVTRDLTLKKKCCESRPSLASSSARELPSSPEWPLTQENLRDCQCLLRRYRRCWNRPVRELAFL